MWGRQPVGLRSLAPGSSEYRPYFKGGPLERDSAYHQGTVWGWLIGPFVDRVKTVSDHMDADFALKYGTLIKERRWHRRAVFVVDRNNKVTYVAYMPVLGQEPNYDEVLAAARAAL